VIDNHLDQVRLRIPQLGDVRDDAAPDVVQRPRLQRFPWARGNALA